MVGASRFERPTSCSQGRRATRLRHAPTRLSYDTLPTGPPVSPKSCGHLADGPATPSQVRSMVVIVVEVRAPLGRALARRALITHVTALHGDQLPLRVTWLVCQLVILSSLRQFSPHRFLIESRPSELPQNHRDVLLRQVLWPMSRHGDLHATTNELAVAGGLPG